MKTRPITLGKDKIYHGDCIEIMKQMPDAQFDLILTDPPYAEVDRDYGRFSEKDWHKMINAAMEQYQRLLKPNGSAVLILQPNGRKIGSMRPWLFEFLAKWTREWNMIQDVWWFNLNTPPGAWSSYGLLRGSLKSCAWFGPADCTRFQERVPVARTDSMYQMQQRFQVGVMVGQMDKGKDVRKVRNHYPSGQSIDRARMVELMSKRQGSTPYNVLPIGNGAPGNRGGDFGHGAATPIELCDWWLRYLMPTNGLVLDSFIGSGTVGIAARLLGFNFVGIEREKKYVDVAVKRLSQVQTRPKALFK